MTDETRRELEATLMVLSWHRRFRLAHLLSEHARRWHAKGDRALGEAFGVLAGVFLDERRVEELEGLDDATRRFTAYACAFARDRVGRDPDEAHVLALLAAAVSEELTEDADARRLLESVYVVTERPLTPEELEESEGWQPI